MKTLLATLAFLLAGTAHPTNRVMADTTGLYPALATFGSYVAAGASIELVRSGPFPDRSDDDTLIGYVTTSGTLTFVNGTSLEQADTVIVTVGGAVRTFLVAGTIGPSGVVWVRHPGPDGEQLRIPLTAAVRRITVPQSTPGAPPGVRPDPGPPGPNAPAAPEERGAPRAPAERPAVPPGQNRRP